MGANDGAVDAMEKAIGKIVSAMGELDVAVALHWELDEVKKPKNARDMLWAGAPSLFHSIKAAYKYLLDATDGLGTYVTYANQNRVVGAETSPHPATSPTHFDPSALRGARTKMAVAARALREFLEERARGVEGGPREGASEGGDEGDRYGDRNIDPWNGGPYTIALNPDEARQRGFRAEGTQFYTSRPSPRAMTKQKEPPMCCCCHTCHCDSVAADTDPPEAVVFVAIPGGTPQ